MIAWARSVLAIGEGLFLIVLVQVLEIALLVGCAWAFPATVSWPGILQSPLVMSLDLAVSALAMLLGGARAARRAGRAPVLHAVIVALLVMALLWAFYAWLPPTGPPSPTWYRAGSWVIPLPAAILGAALADAFGAASRSRARAEGD